MSIGAYFIQSFYKANRISMIFVIFIHFCFRSMAERKNFRSNYYEKVGFKSVDVKKSLESILSEPVVDRTKLTQFVVKFEIPVQYRVTIWKYLLSKY